jgi:hypothetical protein
LNVPSVVNASSTQAKRNDTRLSVSSWLSNAVGKSFVRFLARGDGTTSSSIQPLAFALHLIPKAYSDIGYQGIEKLHLNSRLPHKKPRGKQLTPEQKADNRALARRRVVPIASQSLLENLPHSSQALPQSSSPLWLAL